MNEQEGLATILVGTIREIVRQELRDFQAQATTGGVPVTAESRWLTPPQAARQTGISAKTIRGLIKEGAIKPRSRNAHTNPKQKKYLVNIDEVTAVAARQLPTAGGAAAIEDRARQILAARNPKR